MYVHVLVNTMASASSATTTGAVDPGFWHGGMTSVHCRSAFACMTGAVGFPTSEPCGWVRTTCIGPGAGALNLQAPY